MNLPHIDKKQQQLFELKDNLENIVLYLNEIEQTLDILDSNPDEEVKEACKIKLAQIQQYIVSINNSLADPTAPKYKLKS